MTSERLTRPRSMAPGKSVTALMAKAIALSLQRPMRPSEREPKKGARKGSHTQRMACRPPERVAAERVRPRMTSFSWLCASSSMEMVDAVTP